MRMAEAIFKNEIRNIGSEITGNVQGIAVIVCLAILHVQTISILMFENDTAEKPTFLTQLISKRDGPCLAEWDISTPPLGG